MPAVSRLQRALALGSACLAVQAGCLLAIDFDQYDELSTAAGAGAGANGGAASGGGGAGGTSDGAGGDGGSTPCVADLDTDPANCGACNWDCAGADCIGGVCQLVSTDLQGGTWVTVVDEHVFVVQTGASCPQDGLDHASIHVFDVLFAPGSVDIDPIPTLDHCGLQFASGPDRAYYAPQDSDGVLESCTAQDCERVFYDLAGDHINGVAATDDGGLLYVIFAAGTTTQLRRANIVSDGIPAASTSLLATSTDGSAGGQLVMFDPTTQNVWWMTHGSGGCIYRESLASLDGGPRTCFALSPSQFDPDLAIGRIAIAPEGGLFVLAEQLDGKAVVYRIDASGAASTFGPSSVSVNFVRSDGDHVYVGYPDGGFNVLDPDSGEIVTGLFVPYAVVNLVALDPDFVFFTGGNKLHRWRKLPPR